MALIALFEIPGMTKQQYEGLMAEGFQNRLAPGVISHAAGPMEGGFWAVDVYESQEVADRLAAQIGPALGRLGLSPRITVRPIENLLLRQ